MWMKNYFYLLTMVVKEVTQCIILLLREKAYLHFSPLLDPLTPTKDLFVFFFFFVCRVHEESEIGYTPDSYEPAFLFKNRI